jgi:hypothetical protein
MPDLKISELPVAINPSLEDLILTASLSGTNNNNITVGTFRNNLFTQFPTATAIRSAMGTTGLNNRYGGTLASNGKIYAIPSAATNILIIDPVAGTATRSAMGADLTGSGKWFGGVLAPNGKIYGIPFNAFEVLIITPDLNTSRNIPLETCMSAYYNKF